MLKKLSVLLLYAASYCTAAVQAPREYLGFAPGDDCKLADSGQIFGYFRSLAAASDRIRLVEFGRSALSKPMYVALISAPENLAKLDHYREISRRLALAQATPEEARALAETGKAVVWIDSGLHASEVAPAQHAPELAYRMVTAEDAETQAIRKNVILMQIPVINPDGLDWIAHWYRENVGTPYETAPLPWLYEKYAGHDNNRDWFMLNLKETRNVTRLMFQEWFPQIVYNQHQAPAFPARIFVPPYAEPLNPHIPAAVMEGINRIGMTIKERFARENKPGVLSYYGFDGWWNGGLRSVPAFHNMHGILTETALYAYATPREYQASEIPRQFGNGIPAREPSIFYEHPWLGGKWTLRDAIDYMLTADFAILSDAASRRADYLLKSYQMARASIEAGQKGNPYAYVISPAQWDRPTALEFLERLSLAGVQVKRAAAAFQANGKSYPEGTYVLPAAQPFRPYLLDLLEPQKYPVIRAGVTGPTKKPYDIAGWTLSMEMGVNVDRLDSPFDANLLPVTGFAPQGAVRGQGGTILLDHRENASFLATASLLERGAKVQWAADGQVTVMPAKAAIKPGDLAREFGVTVSLAGTGTPKPAYELRGPRVALYQPWIANADEGWTEWLLDHYRIPYTLLHNSDFAGTDLRTKFDTIIFAEQGASSILHGVSNGELSRRAGSPAEIVQRPEYTGGIGAEGLHRLETFIREGGTLVAFDRATELPLEFLPLPVRNVLQTGSGSEFYCPGSLLRMAVDTSQPLAFGMPEETIGFSTAGGAFESTLASEYNAGDREIRAVVRYAGHDLLASGWASGEKAVLGKSALTEARYGQGRLLLFGFRPQFRGQTYATFKLLLNAIYLGSAEKL